MATRATKISKTAKETRKGVLCRDCIHSGNRIERDVKGEFFMCWCRFEQWAQFLRQPHVCNHYQAGEPIKDEPDPWDHHKPRQ